MSPINPPPQAHLSVTADKTAMTYRLIQNDKICWVSSRQLPFHKGSHCSYHLILYCRFALHKNDSQRRVWGTQSRVSIEKLGEDKLKFISLFISLKFISSYTVENWFGTKFFSIQLRIPLISTGPRWIGWTASSTLCVHITESLNWALHTDSAVRKARQRLFHFRHLRKFRVLPQTLRNFYFCTNESILMRNITVWYENSTKQDLKALQRGICSAEHTIGGALPCLKDIYIRLCRNKARRIIKDPNHLDNN